ncbi:DUF6711 family protein [Turicibacter sanguinis]|uniref:DUF6711 family protein n=2 Tax=Turicibacter sanguinis TaxID=154288 RepID=UPI0021D4A6E6|nr:DUF6711 family protein [Turicibacter sanguinis]MCU7195934.1 hypothetical protein [Turicibacter sanguinis]
MGQAFITMSGQDFTPSACTIIYQDLDYDSGRAMDGSMLRNKLATKVSLNLEWNTISVQEMSRILKAINPTFFPVTYFSPEEGEFVTSEFYVAEKSVPIYSYINGQIKYNAGFSFSLVER